MHRYLLLTGQGLEVDMFNFDWWVAALQEYRVVGGTLASLPDISYGKEALAVACTNTVDRSVPEYLEYSTTRLPQPGVPLTLDQAFLAGCECGEDCRVAARCACQRLTREAAAAVGGAGAGCTGYSYRRLEEPAVGGIYECNPSCSCAATCLNR